jgi:DNA-binding HxlR family transcriptional regulator
VTERSYAQFCGVARALDVIGGRWTLLIVRNLLLGPRRYSTLQAELPGITTNVLAARLQHLQAHGIAERVVDDDHNAWALTAEGALLEAVVMELGRFGSRTMKAPKRGERVDVGWGLLSAKRRYRGGLVLSVELRLHLPKEGVRVFSLNFSERYLQVQDRPAVAPDLVVSMAGEVFRAVFFGGGSVDACINDGAIVVAGTATSWCAFKQALSLTA